MTVPKTRAQETFYEGFWDDREASAKAIREERDRWEAIRRMVEIYVLPAIEERPMTILDLGCGRGWLTHLLSMWGKACGIDPLEASVDHARRRFPELNFERATGGDLLAKGLAAHFDLIVSSEVIEHVPHGEQLYFLKDGAHLLAPGGRWILTTPRGELWPEWQRVPRTLQPVEAWLTEARLDSLAGEAGLRILGRDRAHRPRRSPTWQGRLLGSLLERRMVRDLPLGSLRRHLAYAAKLYQVVIFAHPNEASG